MSDSLTSRTVRKRWPWVVGAVILAAVLGTWWWNGSQRPDAQAAKRASAFPVVTAQSETRDVAVKLRANGTVTALQTVDLRAQITSTVQAVHIREGQNVQQGDLLFTLDARAEEANLKKSDAQVEKDRADLATAQRDLERQRELFTQKFISQAALDVAENKVDTLKGQLAVDLAAVDSSKVARAYTEIRAPFGGRTGLIQVRAGSLVQPTVSTSSTSLPLVTITQIDPISVAFTLPEQELASLQQALRTGSVPVTATARSGAEAFKGKVSFVDNAVDTATGTIRVKAEFANSTGALWPGMYVNVEVAPRTLPNAVVIPTQAVQTGPENRFVYVVGADGKVAARIITVDYLEEAFAAVSGITAGERVVAEGAQNLRAGSAVVEAERAPGTEPPKLGKGDARKRKG
jgi:RND family efflux transporter MFP subunit